MPKKENKIDGEVKEKEYVPTEEESLLQVFLDRRIKEMKDYREILGIEDDWKEADTEYVPSNLKLDDSRKVFEQDQDVGKRSRPVRVGTDEDSWRSDISDPVLLSKIQAAISIIIDRDPQASLSSFIKKFEKTSTLINGLWKRNWKISESKQVFKLFIFDLAKYGWAVGRSYPCVIKYNKKVLTEYDYEKPENSIYEDKELIWYNDVKKQRLDPFRTWIDEMTKPYDRFSMNDCYYEIDYSYDSAKIEFDKYKNFDKVGDSAKLIDLDNLSDEQKKQQDRERKDIITVGFYENRLKDQYVIYVPSKKIILHEGPLPNDDGLLSIWQTMWVLRDSNNPYGISLWKMIKGKKELYDKMMNMTMDQLVLSIYKMFFYTGTTDLFGDGKIKIKPGMGRQIQNGKIDWNEVPGPGQESWKGLEYIKSGMDDDSGITPTIEGEITGKTLGEVLHAKEASLKRLKVPVENISHAIEQDAYLTISWMKQIYSTPEVKEFSSVKDMLDYEKESGNTHDENGLYGKLGDNGEIGNLKAAYYPELSLHLQEKEGQLYESKESRYFQVGKDIKLNDLNWRGIIEVNPISILAPSEELEKQAKQEIFNLLVPVLPLDPNIFYKSAKQLIKARDEDPEDWLPDSWLDLDKASEPLFIAPQMPQNVPQEASGGNTMQGAMGVTPNTGGQTVVPQNQINQSAKNTGL
jgi:hypothetical protein